MNTAGRVPVTRLLASSLKESVAHSMLYFLHNDVCVWPGNVQVGACFWALPFPEDARTFDLKVGGEVRFVLDNEAKNGKEDSGVYSSADAPMLDLYPWRKRFF